MSQHSQQVIARTANQYAQRAFEDSESHRYTNAGDEFRDRKGRKENGLVELTKKFIDLLKTAPNQTLDLNDAVGILDV